MCGIAGIISQTPIRIDHLNVSSLRAQMMHRGPDGFDAYHVNSINPNDKDKTTLTLLHSRLSILDLSNMGKQPMETRDGQYVMVFNGEIYNYLPLKQALSQLGYHFHSQCDSEVLLYAFVHWGLHVFDKLEGMYAFAIYNRQEQTITLARDEFGIKPLFYSIDDGTLMFASEIKALLAMDKRKQATNPQKVYDYLRFGLTDHGDETMFATVKQVKPAHYLVIDAKRACILDQKRFWQPDTKQICQQASLSERFKETFLTNIDTHLQSHVAVGASLSGGLDSSAIVSGICQLKPDIQLKTFSFISEDAQQSEAKWINVLKKQFGIENHQVQIKPDDLCQDLDDLILAQEQPFGSTTIYAQYRIFKLASQHQVKVMLGGQGADELLGGYHHFIPHRITSMIRQWQLIKATMLLRSACQLPNVNQKAMLYGIFEPMLNFRMQKIFRQFINKGFMPDWFNQDWFNQHDCQPMLLRKASSKDVLKEILLKNIQDYGLVQLLRYEDRNAMAFSIENRVPFLTRQLAEFIFSLPEDHIINNQAATKFVFRQAMKNIMPDEILNRKDKIGFATPEGQWLKQLRPWVEHIINHHQSDAANLPINLDSFRHYCRKILSGEAPYHLAVWRGLCLLRWSELYQVDLSH